MKLNKILSILFICLFTGNFLHAQDKAATPHIKLITAYSKKIDEKNQSNPPMSGTFLVIKWEESTYPETFFWRGNGGWLSCKIEKAQKAGGSYKGKEIALDQIKKGNILLLTPLTGGRFPIPDEIPEKARNTLFYKTAGSSWIAFPVKKISKK